MIEKILDRVLKNQKKSNNVKRIILIFIILCFSATAFTGLSWAVMTGMTCVILWIVLMIFVESKYGKLLLRIYALSNKRETIHCQTFLRFSKEKTGRELGEFFENSAIETNSRKGLCLGVIA